MQHVQYRQNGSGFASLYDLVKRVVVLLSGRYGGGGAHVPLMMIPALSRSMSRTSSPAVNQVVTPNMVSRAQGTITNRSK